MSQENCARCGLPMGKHPVYKVGMVGNDQGHHIFACVDLLLNENSRLKSEILRMRKEAEKAKEPEKDNVVDIGCATTLKVPPKKILSALSKEKGIKKIVVMTERKSGDYTFHSSESDKAWCHWIAGVFQHNLITGDFG